MQLVGGKADAAFRGKLVDNVQIFVLVRHGEGDLQPEAVGQRGDGLQAVAHAHLVPLAVGEGLADQVAAVAGRIDHQVGRLARQAALDKRLERGEIVVLAAE